MTTVTYTIVPHDGGWAYRVGETFSEAFPSHDAARTAARRAAREQTVSGQAAEISYEDSAGHWHTESSSGDDRPKTEVQG